MNKKAFTFDEQKEAEDIIKNGFPTKTIDYSKMYKVAKYFKHILGYNGKTLEKELIAFCKKHDENFNPFSEAEFIMKWIKVAVNYNLRKIEELKITNSEVSFLKTIDVDKDRRLLFSALVLSKALKNTIKIKKDDSVSSDKYYIHYNNFMNIIHISGIKYVSEVKLADIFNKYSKNFIFHSPEKELIQIKYADDKDNDFIMITNLDNIPAVYESMFEAAKVTRVCIDCGEKIAITSHNQKRCVKCGKIAQKIKIKEFSQRKKTKKANL